MKIKGSLIIVFLICLFFITGCTEDKNEVISNNEKVNTADMKIKHCTREASAGSDIDVELSYDLYYTGEDLNILHSQEKVSSEKKESLDLYEDAYKKVQANYEGLKYYDAKVIREEKTVTSDITINYDKIDIEKLLEIEGEEDNIIENGKAKVDAWLTLAKKFGTKCEDIEA